MEGIHSRDLKKIAEALQAAFELMDSQPHEEGPHTNDSTGEEI